MTYAVQNDSNTSGCYRYLMKGSIAEDVSADRWGAPMGATIRAPNAARHDLVISEAGRKYSGREASLLFGVNKPDCRHGRQIGASPAQLDREHHSTHQDMMGELVHSFNLPETPPSRRGSWAQATEFTPQSSEDRRITPMQSSTAPGYFSQIEPMAESSIAQFLAFQMHCLLQQSQYLLGHLSLGHSTLGMTPPHMACSPTIMPHQGPALTSVSVQHNTPFGPPTSPPYGLQPYRYPAECVAPLPQIPTSNHKRNRSYSSAARIYPPHKTARASEDHLRSPRKSFGPPVKECNQRSLREVFAFIQDKLEYFVRGFVCMDATAATGFASNEALVQRCYSLIGNRQASIHALQQPELHGALVIGLVWQMASILIFGEALMNQFPSEHSLVFAESWAAEARERDSTPRVTDSTRLERLMGNRARIAKQIVKISGFWSDWRVEFSTNVTGQIMLALDRVFSPEFQDQASKQLRDIIQKMIDVAVRLRQECSWFDLKFPKHGDRFDMETMVGAHTNGRSCIDSSGRPMVVFAKSPSLIETKFVEGNAESDTHYKSECLIRERASM